MNLIEKIELLKESGKEQAVADNLKFLHAYDFYTKNSTKMSDAEAREFLKTLMIYARHNMVYQMIVLESTMDFVDENETKEIFRAILVLNKQIQKQYPGVMKGRVYRMLISRVHEKYGNCFRDNGNSAMAIRCYQNALENLPGKTGKYRELLDGQITSLMLSA